MPVLSPLPALMLADENTGRLCAPFFFTLRNGPSTCSPSGSAPWNPAGRPPVTTRSPSDTVSSGEVMIVGRNVVTP